MDVILQPKQRTSASSGGIPMANKDPPPKYMDAKLAVGSKKITPISSHATNKYSDKQLAPPPPSTHINQSHLASKSLNYHQQQSHQQLPPNYSQTINHRNAHPQQQQPSSDYLQMSVQQQQQSTAQHNPYTSNLSSDSSYSVVGRQPPDELMMHGMLMDTTDQTKPPTSIFSPDWTDVKPSKVLPPVESPKLPSTDRQRTDLTPKKDKTKRESPMNAGGLVGQKSMSSSSLYPAGQQQDPNKRGNSNNSSFSASVATSIKREYSAPQIQPYDKSMYNKSRQQIPPNASIKMETDEDQKSIVKRSHSEAAGQYDDPIAGDYNRDSKLRKFEMDLQQLQQQQHSFAGSSSFSTSQSGHMLKGTTIFNGIETNPDLVSSLLKESLADSKYSSTIKLESIPPQQILQTTPSVMDQPPLNQLSHPELITKSHFQAPPPPYQPLPAQPSAQIILESIGVGSAPAQDTLPTNVDLDTDHKTKSEKKKKKEKSKHKEKDKSRDKEERKKHKKDKDRNREKDSRSEDTSSSGMVHNPLKIKIPKEKLNLSASTDGSAVAPPTSGFKITIPKDRLLTGLAMDATAPPAGASLKIKISKDVIENYHGGYSSSGTGAGSYDGSAAGGGSTGGTTNSQHHYHSKKRDRDRGDRGEGKGGGHNEMAMNRGGGGGTAGSANVTH